MTHNLSKQLIGAVAGGLMAALTIASPAAATDSPMFVTIHEAGSGHTARDLTVPLDKSVIVELPVDAADIMVTNPEIVDAVVRTPRRTYLMGRGVGQTNVYFFDARGRQILDLEIRVERDLAPLTELYQELIPGANIEVNAINDNLVLTGFVPNAVAADQARDLAGRFVGNPEAILNMLGIEANDQVMLQVRIVEMQRSLARQVGVDLSAAFSTSNLLLNPATVNPLSVVGRSLGGLGVAGGASNSFRWTPESNQPGEYLDGTIRAFERNGLLRMLAEPNLTAISGERADFLAGGEFPVPTGRDREGNVTIDFKPFGVGLGFTPVVLSEGRISLRIATEVSELSSDGALQLESNSYVDPDSGDIITVPGSTIPGLTVRRAETTVELPSGGSMVIAGLLQDQTRRNIDGVPWVKDVPVLGALFRSEDYQNSETELVIIVTPYVVDPVSMSELATPDLGYVPANAVDSGLLGRLHAMYGVGEGATGRRLQGPVGYIVE